MVVGKEVVVGLVEPLVFFHFFEKIDVFVGVVLDNRVDFPQRQAVFVGTVPEEDINLHLPELIVESIIQVTLQRSQ